jgi:hypothetical protein
MWPHRAPCKKAPDECGHTLQQQNRADAMWSSRLGPIQALRECDHTSIVITVREQLPLSAVAPKDESKANP